MDFYALELSLSRPFSTSILGVNSVKFASVTPSAESHGSMQRYWLWNQAQDATAHELGRLSP